MSTTPDVCPVDHKAMAAAAAKASPATCPVDHKSTAAPAPASADACPVDHNAREAWLQQARAANATAAANVAPHPNTLSSTPAPPAPRSWSSTLWSYVPFTSSSVASNSSSNSSSTFAPPAHAAATPRLGIDREVSTIPRASAGPNSAVAAPSARPSNHEIESGADPVSGNWIYPSEKMFFEAMRRKGHEAQAADMQTVVPIHNAVNERAWQEIKEWEKPYLAGSACDVPRLHSFSGMSTKLTPRARFNTLLGYQAPFDRHDWVVDRCGETIEYVIDFYPGRPKPNGQLSFYLDVRPKLNSWEGVKMRFLRSTGLV
ncbi:uncharacterized protein BROUX77_004073 [Berkeleyomyces rouxiae]|uniref:uncharacterized protein n=1 Tax=Berkeleyomyces rouxiae TaxID=2035830 RepID=UPI003B7C1EEA